METWGEVTSPQILKYNILIFCIYRKLYYLDNYRQFLGLVLEFDINKTILSYRVN